MSDPDPRRYIHGAKRCALGMTEVFGAEWFVGVSPRNGPGAAVEGTWEDWCDLARGILAADEAWKNGDSNVLDALPVNLEADET